MPRDTANVSQLIRDGETYLVANDVPNARRNAEWLLSHTLGCRAADLYLDTQRVPDPKQRTLYNDLLERRGAREPLQYIIGSTEFMGLSFYSQPGVFIPRPETERLVEAVEAVWRAERPRIDAAKADVPVDGRPTKTVLDLGCGSGAIAVSLLARDRRSAGVAVDTSRSAVELTRKNAKANGVADRLDVVEADAVEFVRTHSVQFDAIVSNPPYVNTDDIVKLPPEIRVHEPPVSLDGGADGMDFYRRLVPVLSGALRPGGIVAFEIGADQGEGVSALLEAASYVDIAVHRDYAGLDRVVVAHRGG